MATTEITIGISTPCPSGYAGDNPYCYLDCPDEKLDQVLQSLDKAIQQVAALHGLTVLVDDD